jgi:hypothetical protein
VDPGVQVKLVLSVDEGLAVFAKGWMIGCEGMVP